MKKLIIVLLVLLVVVLIIGFMPSPAEPEPEAVSVQAVEFENGNGVTFSRYDGGNVLADFTFDKYSAKEASALVYLIMNNLNNNDYKDYELRGSVANSKVDLVFNDKSLDADGSKVSQNFYTFEALELVEYLSDNLKAEAEAISGAVKAL